MIKTFTSLLALTIATSAFTHPDDEEKLPKNSGNMSSIAAPAVQEGESTEEGEKAEKDKKWDVSNPPLPMREIKIDVDEGTWMNVDVSPDGKTIIFDLLGDIYSIPMSGGSATPLASGHAYDAQASFSPDGKRIVFTSDRGGGDNVWIMNADGSDKRQVTKEKFRVLNNPTWAPNGDYIVVKKLFTTARSLGTGEIWMYHLGGGSGVSLVKRPSESYQKEIGEPAFSPDGKYVYYTKATSSGDTFTYAQDSNRQAFVINRYELASGEIDAVVTGPGGSVRAEPSPDGKSIAFVRFSKGSR